jgi:hypothetical protein
MTLYSLVYISQRFGRAYCLHSHTLKIVAAGFFGTLVNLYQITRYFSPSCVFFTGGTKYKQETTGNYRTLLSFCKALFGRALEHKVDTLHAV